MHNLLNAMILVIQNYKMCIADRVEQMSRSMLNEILLGIYHLYFHKIVEIN